MSDDEESFSDIVIDQKRENEIEKDVLSNLEVLNQKTVNFEDLINELVRKGCLSFEEKFKILSGIAEETQMKKTLPEKCTELYHTLMKKNIPWARIIRCWEDTGNNYLVGRFDTHFSIEGRDSKSLKFSKFKALPSHRTEYLTHLSLKNLQLSPKSLLKCLRKSTRLISIRLERVKVPYGGRESDDPSTDFEVPLMLPNLREFYFEEVTKHASFESLKEINFFLDELNLKPMLFFGLNSNMSWDAGIYIRVRMRNVNILKMLPDPLSDETESEDTEVQPHFISMLRRRPVEFGGFINPQFCPKVSLYEVYIPKEPFPQDLTHLVIYRCRISNFDPLVQACPNLVRISLYGEFESKICVTQLSLVSLSNSSASLRELSLGCLKIVLPSLSEQSSMKSFTLDLLCLDSCFVANACETSEAECNQTLRNFFGSIEKVDLIYCSIKLITSFIGDGTSNELNCNSISVYGLSWDKIEEGDNCAAELKKHVTKALKSKEDDFTLSWIEKDNASSWKFKKSLVDCSMQVYKDFHWNVFCDVINRSGWFDLPLRKPDDALSERDTDPPRKVFRNQWCF